MKKHRTAIYVGRKKMGVRQRRNLTARFFKQIKSNEWLLVENVIDIAHVNVGMIKLTIDETPNSLSHKRLRSEAFVHYPFKIVIDGATMFFAGQPMFRHYHFMEAERREIFTIAVNSMIFETRTRNK
jgi:hypothetical protein